MNLRSSMLALLLLLPLGCSGGQDVSAPTESGPMPVRTFLAHGEQVFTTAGCVDCHGFAGDEGPPPFDGAPPLTRFVDRFGFVDDSTRDQAVEWLADDMLHDFSHDYDEAFEGFEQFLVAARIYEDLISGTGHATPFALVELAEPMPPWGQVFSDRDIEALMAYLLVTYSD